MEKTVKVSAETYKKIKLIAKGEKRTIKTIVDMAIDLYWEKSND